MIRINSCRVSLSLALSLLSSPQAGGLSRISDNDYNTANDNNTDNHHHHQHHHDKY